MVCFPGSLNVELPFSWSTPSKCIRIEPGEGGCKPGVSITACKINGREAFIVRTDLVESDQPVHPDFHPKTVVEIICDIKLRDEFGLIDRDMVKLELIDDTA